MRTFEFCGQNLLNTTSMLKVDSGTGTLSYLFDRNTSLDYQSVDYTGNTSTVLSVEFDSPTVVSRIMIQNHNLKAFRVFYNSATANTFTPDYQITGNSATSHFLAFSSITVSSIQIQMDDVIDLNQERSIGELIITDCNVSLPNNPSANDYDPKLYKQKIKHTMPDGGTSMFLIGNKFQANMKLKFLSTTTKDLLLAVNNDGNPFYFVPEGTTTGWLGHAYEVVWTNDFDFTYSENSKTQGWDGSIKIEETPGA
jgi:hypothetical protein